MVTAIVMAGRRDGHVDPLAASAGVKDKCVVPVAGRPMIDHVLGALAAASEIAHVVVSVNDATVIERVDAVRSLAAEGRLVISGSRTNLVDSLLAAVEAAAFPVLITTADNVLLTPAAITEFIAGASATDVAVAFARRDAVLSAHPEGQRRFYRFADDQYCNCNTYWVGNDRALRAAEVFRSGGQFAKHPLRIVQAFGLINLIRFRHGIGTLDEAFRRFSRRFAVSIRPVILSDGAVAVDVDNDRTLRIAEQLLSQRPRIFDKAGPGRSLV